jgi:hypothetical protein
MSLDNWNKTKDWILGGLLTYLCTVASLAAYKIVSIDRVQTIHEYRIAKLEETVKEAIIDIARADSKNEQQDLRLQSLEAILPDGNQKKRTNKDD